MKGKYIQTEFSGADLLKYPPAKAPLAPGQELTIGDLHGNALKLLWISTYHELIDISEADYRAFAAIYRQNTSDTRPQDIENFNNIVKRIKVKNKDIFLRLIGDIFCDRGENDYYVAILLGHLSDIGINSEVLFSNHDAEFVRVLAQFDREVKSGKRNNNPKDFAAILRCGILKDLCTSMQNLKTALEKKIISEENFQAFQKIIREKYLPQLKLVSYNLADDGSITIYTHAPCGMEVIKSAAQKLGVGFKDGTSEEIAKSIDRINVQFSHYITGQEQVSIFELGDPISMIDLNGNHTDNPMPKKVNQGFFDPETIRECPLTYLIWARLSNQNHIYKIDENIYFVFGHDAKGQVITSMNHYASPLPNMLDYDKFPYYRSHITNLDNAFGYSAESYEDSKYSYYIETRRKDLSQSTAKLPDGATRPLASSPLGLKKEYLDRE